MVWSSQRRYQLRVRGTVNHLGACVDVLAVDGDLPLLGRLQVGKSGHLRTGYTWPGRKEAALSSRDPALRSSNSIDRVSKPDDLCDFRRPSDAASGVEDGLLG